MFVPSRPAIANVSGLPPAVIQTGGVACTGGGKIFTLISRPSPFIAVTGWPLHSVLIVSMPSAMIARRFSKLAGASTKSLACQPDANERPTRPPDRLSTTDQSSAQRIGFCNGRTTLPALIEIRSVTIATAALVTAGLG